MSNVLPAGRELDQLIAEKVMGLGKLPIGIVYEPGDPPSGPFYLCPFYSTDIASAWPIIGTMFLKGWVVYINNFAGSAWTVGFSNNSLGEGFAQDENPAAAICLAALKALDGQTTQVYPSPRG